MKKLLVCDRDPECPWTIIVDPADQPAWWRAEGKRKQHHAVHERRAARLARQAVRAQRRSLKKEALERSTVRAAPPARAEARGRATVPIAARTYPHCECCRMGLFPGHGHRLSDGTVTQESAIRWA